MAYVIADNIMSPLGENSEENYLSVKAGKSMLHTYQPGSYAVQEGFCASLMEKDNISAAILKTYFERLAFASASKAIRQSGINVARHRVLFILSTTKGSIEELGKVEDEEVYLGTTAQHIAAALGITTKPIVVCNACISGLSALILASRLLDADALSETISSTVGNGSSISYDYVVVCGADSPRRFIISGFQSLKALSTEPCHPFDMERFGLNLGEAAATIILGRTAKEDSVHPTSESAIPSHGNISKNVWRIERGYIKNDAFHISAPSKTSEGLYACLHETLQGMNLEDIGFINAHGTATLFNDQMESVAIQRAGLSQVPTDALKGYLGHTLGAAGILETILCMKAADDHIIIGTRGFEELGVSGKMDISAANRSLAKQTFVKMLSGFGGCNATLLATKEKKGQQQLVEKTICAKKPTRIEKQDDTKFSRFIRSHHVTITTKGVTIDGNRLNVSNETEDASMLTAIYKQYIGGYPKYYKMDGLSRLGFIASELLLQVEVGKHQHDFDRAVILFNRSSSIASDKKYLASIADKDNYFPSPSIFVYTLPNIVTGEIAIRNGYHGETSFYVLPEKNEVQMQEIWQTAFMDAQTQSAVTGWLDYEDSTHFEADLYIVERGVS